MDVSKKVNFIKEWILNYVDSMPKKADSLVIGISGGIDSSVSSTLSAMTGLKTIVLSMPIKQKSSQHDLSLLHANWLKGKYKNVEHHLIDIDKIFPNFRKSFKNHFGTLIVTSHNADLNGNLNKFITKSVIKEIKKKYEFFH